MTNDEFISIIVTHMNDLSKKFSRYEMVDVAIKYFRCIDITGEHPVNFVHLA